MKMTLCSSFRLATFLTRSRCKAQYSTSSRDSFAQPSDADKLAQDQSDVELDQAAFAPTDTFREDIYLEFNRTMISRAAESTSDDIDRQRLMDTEQKRNVSRMRPWHQMLVNKQVPPVKFNWQLERNALKARFAKYGRKSGVNPGLLWPTDRELDEQQALDRDMQPHLLDALRTLSSEQKAEALKRTKRFAEVEANEKKYSKMLAEFEAEQRKVEKDTSEYEAKQQEKIREIQEYFGYWIDPKDPRFAVMQQQKEAEEQKSAKAARKAEIQKKKVATVTNS